MSEYKPDYSFGGIYASWRIAREEAQDLTNHPEVRAAHLDWQRRLEQQMKAEFPVEWSHIFGASPQ